MRTAFGFSLAVLLLFAGCNSDTTKPGAPMGRVFLKDAPAADLDEFNVTLSKVSMVASGGGEVVLFSGTPVTENLLDLRMIEKLIAAATLPPGTYTGLRLTVTAISATANGAAQTVTMGGGLTLPATIEAVFSHPFVLVPGVTADISVDFDVAASVTDGGGNSIIVQPVAFAEVEIESHDAGEVEGVIVSINAAAGILVLMSDEDDDDDPAGSFTVQITPNTLLEFEDSCLQGAASLAALAVGVEIEVEGARNGSTIVADRIEIEMNHSGPGGSPGLRVEGLVTAKTATTATVKILGVKGDSGGALAGLASVTVDLSQSPILLPSRGGPADLADIDLGEKILVQGTKPGADFLAFSVFLDRTRFQGIVTASGAGSLTLGSLKAEGVAVAGLASRTFVVPAGTPISLDDVLPLALSAIAVGQEVELKAVRDASTDQWVALQIEVDAGEIEGIRSGISSIQASSFVMIGDGTELGLGNPTTLTVVVSPASLIALIQGGATTMIPPANLSATLTGLASTAKVEVEGVLSGPGQLQAVKIVLKP